MIHGLILCFLVKQQAFSGVVVVVGNFWVQLKSYPPRQLWITYRRKASYLQVRRATEARELENN